MNHTAPVQLTHGSCRLGELSSPVSSADVLCAGTALVRRFFNSVNLILRERFQRASVGVIAALRGATNHSGACVTVAELPGLRVRLHSWCLA